MPVLALDFDGVISDSATEAFFVALRTYVALRPGASASLRETLAGVEAAWAEGGRAARARVAASELYGAFVDAMPLGNRAEDFGVELAAFDRGLALPSQEAYDAHARALADEDPSFFERFHGRFYAERDALAAADPDGWVGLLGPYPELVALLRRRAGARTLAIATAKDRPAVERLLAAYGIADLFPPALVLDKEAGRSKRAHLAALRERTGAAFSDVTFVDDKVNHLEDVAPLGVRCALAAWGYNSERERARARALGFAVCDLAGAEAALFG
ncbi:MAG: HAD family hydrolase [Myxococcales bacterium]|nr:HAD family hydrolase [Myxococcales bacterium]